MRKSLLLVVSMLMVLVLAACGGGKVDESTSEKYIAQAEGIVELLNSGEYEEIFAQFDDTMKEALPVNDMAQLTPLIEESGDFEEIDKSSIEEIDEMYSVVLAANYSKENRIFTITFNKEGEVAGLYIN